MPVPDALDIANALADLAAGLRLDPAVVGTEQVWLCVLVDSVSGEQLRAGVGLTMREAAAGAWVASLSVDRLLDAVVGRAAPPLPDGRVRFELCPPGCWERVTLAQHAQRTGGR
jgi:hypothetical protein